MTEDNELYEPAMHALHSLIISDSDESKEEPGSFSCEEEAENNAIPPSLLSYFETSKSRAAVCEKLILEDLEDSDSTAFHHADGLIELTAELNKEERTVNELITLETKSEEVITDDEEIKSEISECEAERQKHSSEDVQKEEQRRQRELDFQEELWKIMEEEKLHKVNLELIKREAQEKLEQELLLQKDFIRKLQKRLERDRGMIEAERKRKKEEERIRMEKEDRRKRETKEKRKRQDDRKRTEEEKNIKYIDIGLKDKDQTTLKEKDKRKKEADEKRKSEKEKDKKEEMRKEEEGDVRRKSDKEKDKIKEMRKKKEEDEKRKSEQEKYEKEEEMKKKEEEDEKRKSEQEKYKKEEEMKKKEEEDDQRKSEKEKDKREGMREEEEADEKRKSEKEKDKKEEKQRKEEEEEKRKAKKEKDKKEEEVKKKEAGDEKRNSEKEKDTREEEMRKEAEEDEKRKSEREKYKKEEEMEKKEEEIKMACRQFREDEMTRQVEEERHEEKGMKNERTSAIKKRRNEETIKSKNKLIMMEEMEGEEPIIHRSTWVRTKEEEKNEEGQEQKSDEEREERKTGHLDRRKLDEDMVKIQDGIKNVWMSEENNNEDKVKPKTVEDPHVRRGAEEQEYTHAQREEITLRQETEDHGGNAKDPEHKTEIRHHMEETKEDEDGDTKLKEETGGREGKKDSEDEQMFISQKENNDKKSLNSQNEQKGRDPQSPLGPGPSPNESSVRQACSESAQDPLSDRNISESSACERGFEPRPPSCSLQVSLPEHTEQKRLSWMRDCISWSQLSLQNTRRQKGSVLSGRRRRRASGASRLPPLCPDTLLQLSGCTSLQEVTTVSLEDLPCCGLSTLAQCPQLRSLSLRRCGLKSLEGVGQLRELCYIDLQENEISLVDCEHMTGLRVLRLARNKLTTIHGLSGADNLNILDLSHNSITRIAGLESVTRLQRLSVAHNQLISTKGLRDVYTLLHLDLSHNHLTRAEGLENSALLHTLDLRSNSLSEPPSLNNQVLLREVRLDDNSISSVEGLAACWLPLMQTLSVSQNRITQLPSMTDFVSLENMDLRFNCLSELQNVCESLMGCHFLREVHLLGNPLQQDRGWRPTLQKALPGLRAIDSQQTDSFPSALPVQQLNAVPGCFFTLCQAQLQQTQDLQQRHSEELSASSPLDAVKSFSRHFTEAQKLAEDQRFAHEYGDTTVSENTAAVQTIAETALNVDLPTSEGCIDWPEMATASKGTAVVRSKNNIRSNSGSFEEKPAEEINGERTSFNLDKVILSGFHDLGHKKSAAAVLIQRRWRKYRQKCGNVDASIAESEWKTKGDGEEPESGSPFSKSSSAGRDHAATVIQAFWRGFALRRRLACALAAVTWPDAGEEDAFEEVDVEEFVFDEPELEKYWTVTFSEDSPPRHCPKSQQPSSSKPPVSVDDPSQYFRSPPFVQSPRQAWMAEQQVDSVAQRISLQSSNRSQSPASSSGLSGLSERSEKILEEWGFTDSRTAQLMLKRAQRMKLTKRQQKKNCNPSLRLAMIENCTYERGPVEARNRPAQCNRYSLKVGEAGLGLQQAERAERIRREKAPHGQRTRGAQPDRHSDSVHFLPEMNSSILQGGKVQLVAGGPDRPHATGLWANSCLADRPGKANMYSGRNSLGHEKKEVSSPKRVASAPSKKERISFRDNPVQLSGGWGGGKKRDRLHK